MKLTSPVFLNEGMIPLDFTCDGENKNPPLSIREVPVEAKSLALIMDDPDAPRGTWTHWTIWNLAPETREIASQEIFSGALEGLTSFGEAGYGGPCPHAGTHRYYFRLYALDAKLALPAGSTVEVLRQVMSEHILADTELMGRYARMK